MLYRYGTHHRSISVLRSRSVSTAVIGSGPAGFYAAQKLFEFVPGIQIDMYEKYPVPFGLTRFGIAPDHPEVRHCQEKFSEIASSKQFQFVGNVNVGVDLPLSEILRSYNSVLFAYGACHDRALEIPGESLAGVYSARQFVGWYNGDPEHRDLQVPLSEVEDVAIIGQGNVAIDIARVLLTDPAKFSSTDISQTALKCLRESTVKRVNLFGRRGVQQSSFAVKELRELLHEPGVYFSPLDQSQVQEISPFIRLMARPLRRKMELLTHATDINKEKAVSQDTHRSWSLQYQLAPVTFHAHAVNPRLLSSIRLEHTKLRKDSLAKPVEADRTGLFSSFKTDIAIKSIGYRGKALEGFDEAQIPFDEHKGIITNKDGAIVGHENFLFVTGWLKAGPTGAIAHTMKDSFLVAQKMASVLNNKSIERKPGYASVKSHIKSRPVSSRDWLHIDDLEKQRGTDLQIPRHKFTDTKEMLASLQ